jgi:fructose PTS system EIIA component
VTTIDDLINPNLVKLDLEATDRRGAIRELAGLMEQDGRVDDPPTYVEAVLAREEETGGTGMESGVAIPHAKSAAVSRPSLAFGRSNPGIDFGAEDGTPSDLVFLIAAPQGADELHVRVLSRLARKLIHDDFRAALRDADSPEQLVETLRTEVSL